MGSARRTRRLLVLFALAAGMTVPAGGSGQAAFPGPNGRIAFWDFMTGQVYAVNPDGTGLVQLTDVGAGETAAHPGWSPDGRHIAFDSDQSGEPRLYEMDAGGGHEHLLMADRRGYEDFFPRYTPNGRRVVFTRCLPEGACAIWSVRRDGTNRRALTPFQEEVFDFGAQVSPDGTRIVFARFNAGGIISQIYVMGSDGSNPKALTPPALEGFLPDWSPDGQMITFASNCCRFRSNVYVMHPDGSGITRLTETQFPNNSVTGGYSPRGGRIVFSSDRRYDDLCCVELFVMRADGSRERLLDIGLTGVLDPQWGSAPPLASAPSDNTTVSEARLATGGRGEASTWLLGRCVGLPRDAARSLCAGASAAGGRDGSG